MRVELDELTRRERQLEIERQALSKENDAASKERLHRLDDELKRVRTEKAGLRTHWKEEKEAVDKIRSLKAERERIKIEEQNAGRLRAHARVDELRYGQLLQGERSLEQGNAR